MMVLPPARKEFPCKTKNKKSGIPCNQLIYQSDKEKYRSGKFKILNAENGRGGERNQPHVCPDRLDSEFDHTNREVNWKLYHWHQENLPCTFCGGIFNSYLCPLCPNCFKLQCRKCFSYQTWIVKEGYDNQICNVCGAVGMDVSSTKNMEVKNPI